MPDDILKQCVAYCEDSSAFDGYDHTDVITTDAGSMCVMWEDNIAAPIIKLGEYDEAENFVAVSPQTQALYDAIKPKPRVVNIMGNPVTVVPPNKIGEM